MDSCINKVNKDLILVRIILIIVKEQTKVSFASNQWLTKLILSKKRIKRHMLNNYITYLGIVNNDFLFYNDFIFNKFLECFYYNIIRF